MFPHTGSQGKLHRGVAAYALQYYTPNYHMTQQFHCQVCTPTELRTDTQTSTRTCLEQLTQNSQKGGNNPSGHRLMNGSTKRGLFTRQNIVPT